MLINQADIAMQSNIQPFSLQLTADNHPYSCEAAYIKNR
jgi:hypothetical protein